MSDRATASAVPIDPRGAVHRPLAPWLVWSTFAAAGVFAACTVFATTHYLGQRAEALRYSEAARAAELEVRRLTQQLEAERILNAGQIAELEKAADFSALRIAKLNSLGRKNPELVAFVIWSAAREEGILTVEKLPVPKPNEDYQLWIVDPSHSAPVSAGVFAVHGDGTARIAFRPSRATRGATHFAISRERKGGSLVSEGPTVAAGAL